MAGDIPITVVGSITEPVLRFAESGKPWVAFSLAHNSRVKVGDEWQDGPPTWFKVKAFGPIAENIAESFPEKGARVIVMGQARTETYKTAEGEERSALVIVADAVGPDLRWATAKVARVGGGGGSQQAPAQGGMQRSRTAQPQGDPWSDQPPF